MNSIIIARLLGPLLLISAAAIVLNRKGFQKVAVETAKSPSLIYLDGFLTLLGGLAIVEFQNVWTAGWETLITVLGWLMVVGGAARMTFPDQISASAKRMVRQRGALEISSFISAVMGIVLTIEGFSPMS